MSNSNLIFTPQTDYEFIGLSFDNHGDIDNTPIHCSEFNLTVVQDGLTTKNLMPTFKDDLLVVDGRDSAYYFGTVYEPQEFTIVFGFDNLTAEKYKEVSQWLNAKKVKKLIFDESPHKYYWAKVKSTPSISFVPFEEDSYTTGATPVKNGLEHIYKGTITVTFQALDPFAYGDEILLNNVKYFNGSTWVTGYTNTNRPGWFGNTNLLVSTTGYYTDATKDAGQTIASIPIGAFTNKFYNAGTEEVYPNLEFTFTGESVTITNNTNSSEFKISGLTSGTWEITYDPNKGICVGNDGTGDKNLASFVISKIKMSSGDNILATNAILSTFNIKYKNKYL